MKTDHQRTFLRFWVQILGYEDIDADGVLIYEFVAGAVNVEGGELF